MLKKAAHEIIYVFLIMICLLSGCGEKLDSTNPSEKIEKDLNKMQTTVEETEEIREDGARVQSSVSTTVCDDGIVIISTQSSITYKNGNTEEVTIDETRQKDGSSEIEENSILKNIDKSVVKTTTHTYIYADGTQIKRMKIIITQTDGTQNCVESIAMTDATGKESVEESKYKIDTEGNILIDD